MVLHHLIIRACKCIASVFPDVVRDYLMLLRLSWITEHPWTMDVDSFGHRGKCAAVTVCAFLIWVLDYWYNTTRLRRYYYIAEAIVSQFIVRFSIQNWIISNVTRWANFVFFICSIIARFRYRVDFCLLNANTAEPGEGWIPSSDFTLQWWHIMNFTTQFASKILKATISQQVDIHIYRVSRQHCLAFSSCNNVHVIMTFQCNYMLFD